MMKNLLKCILCAVSMSLFAVSAVGADTVKKAVDEVITHYRKIIVLFVDEDQLSEKEQEYAYIVGKILYHEKLDRLQELQLLVDYIHIHSRLRTQLSGLFLLDSCWPRYLKLCGN